MSEREQIRKPSSGRATKGASPEASSVADSENGERLKAELDDQLDEIDGVLETNAEDFVRSFVQKGGQ